MSAKSVSSRYARSLIELAQEQKKLDQIFDDVKYLKKLMKNRELFVMLKSPVIPGDKKMKVMDRLMREMIDDLTMRFVQLVIRKEREELLPYIMNEFIDQYKDIKNISTVRIRSADKLSDESIEKIKQKLWDQKMADGEIEIIEQVDPNLIGGFVLEFDGYRYDASISWKMADIRKKNYGKNLYESKVIAR
jgi:F-type H+-transporting ATPase subunit delta